ncbi:tetratricopeptide repeat protein [Geomonas agri]|uniref:tetratricopeptide repeat protein n=1 Tax=Geomonas agri TaxID=2873702 RepID=UPI001CD2339C|nr:tetratricopeptide repeat protein [Geomonas agri]
MKRYYSEKITPHLLPAAVLLVITIAVYIRILGHDFQIFWDDQKYVLANQAVKKLTLENLKSVFARSYLGNYAPLHLISYMIDHVAWGIKPAGYFLTNITLHACNGLILYMLLIRLGFSRLQAFSSGFIFLIHPVQVESVAWISERKNLLAMFFCLCGFAAYITYRQRGRDGGGKAYLASFTCFVCALLSKSVAVIFPLQLLLYDLCYVERSKRDKLHLAIIPFFCAAAAMAWVTMQSQLPGEMPGLGGGRTGYHGGSRLATFFTMLTVLTRYVKLLFWPTGLSTIYDPPVRTGVDGAVLLGAAILALLVAVGIMLYRRQRGLLFWYSLFFIGLLPVSQIVPIVTLMNDRYLYFPMLGASVCFGSLAYWFETCSGAQRALALLLTGLVFTALALLSFSRAGVWKNDLTLWNDAARKAPTHYVALYGWAQALQNSGDLDAALPVYLRILQKNPRHLDTLAHLGSLYRAKNMPLAGRPYLLDVTRYYPKLPQGFLELGANYYQSGDLGDAETAFRKALTLQPESREANLKLGIITLRTRRLADSRFFLQKVVSHSGTNADVEYNLACVESLSGNRRAALQHLQSSLALGFSDKYALIHDRDLDAIRTLPEYAGLISSLTR